MDTKSEINQIINNCYDFILKLQSEYNKTKKIELDAQQMLQCNLTILNTVNDVYIKRAESEHLMKLKDKQFELEKDSKSRYCNI